MEGLSLILLPVAFIFGIIIGRRSRRYPLQNADQAATLQFFLAKEIWRHWKDIRRARRDVRRIEDEFGVCHIGETNLDAWIDARKEWP